MTYTCLQGRNEDLIAEVAKLYLKDRDKVFDMTYGKGCFWKKINTCTIELITNDIDSKIKSDYHLDCRNLGVFNSIYDIVVLDLPYMHNSGKPMVDKTYNNTATTKGMYHKDIINMYDGGMKEAHRLLKPGGLLWVKIQDEIESSKQKWSHIEIYDLANYIGFYAKDLFVLHQANKPVIQHKNQQHARKNHSYMWIFKKIK